MKLVLADINEAGLSEVCAQCATKTGQENVFFQVTDVSKLADIERLQKVTLERFGEVAFLMNNAGVGGGGGPYEKISRWQTVLDVNLWGVINGCQTFVPAMIAQGTKCVVVNTGSKQGMTCPPGDTAYNVSKAGVKVLTEALQHKLRSTEGCKVNAFLLVPGWTVTMLMTKAQQRIQGAAFDPSSMRDERSDAATIQGLHKMGAVSAPDVVDRLLSAVNTGAPFYIICEDNETSEALDNARLQWAADDVIFKRVPLSRWSEQYGAEYKTVVQGL
jgi:NAD(P)-dependent dehydrogenase (short-subunit alcohol dehydrogenase family)